MKHEANAGTGPGVITPDGCAVDFYALLPPMGEPEIIAAAAPPGASILELGCGTGRLLGPADRDGPSGARGGRVGGHAGPDPRPADRTVAHRDP